MLWVVAVIFTIVVVIIGIRKWKRANNPLYAMEIKNRKAWLERNKRPPLPSSSEDDAFDDLTTNPAYSSLMCNAYYDFDDD